MDDSGTVADNGATDADKDTEGVHEVIRMQAPFRTMGNFIDIVHEKYPEINLEAVPYSGQNYTAYVKAQLNSGDLPGRMPYLSEDGSQNSYILNVSRYIGLNKHLADAGNEQKLQDTGIVGLTAAQEYFSQFDTLSEKDLV